MHESHRVYGDKLVDDKDNVNFQKFVFDVFKKHFEVRDNFFLLYSCNLICRPPTSSSNENVGKCVKSF